MLIGIVAVAMQGTSFSALTLILGLALTVCSGCIEDLAPRHYKLSIGGDPPVLIFDEIGEHEVAKLKRIEFYETDDSTGLEKEMWSIYPNSKNPSGASVSRIDYGRLPDGWLEAAPAKQLLLKNRHRLSLLTITGKFDVRIPGKRDDGQWGICASE